MPTTTCFSFWCTVIQLQQFLGQCRGHKTQTITSLWPQGPWWLRQPRSVQSSAPYPGAAAAAPEQQHEHWSLLEPRALVALSCTAPRPREKLCFYGFIKELYNFLCPPSCTWGICNRSTHGLLGMLAPLSSQEIH